MKWWRTLSSWPSSVISSARFTFTLMCSCTKMAGIKLISFGFSALMPTVTFTRRIFGYSIPTRIMWPVLPYQGLHMAILFPLIHIRICISSAALFSPCSSIHMCMPQSFKRYLIEGALRPKFVGTSFWPKSTWNRWVSQSESWTRSWHFWSLHTRRTWLSIRSLLRDLLQQ